MSWLLAADLHLNDKAKDGYRFGLFGWLAKQQERLKTEATFILGDLTEKKDKHSSVLVNKTVDGLMKLKPPIYIVMGNHDYIDPENPFFKFLNNVEGVHYVINPLVLDKLGVGLLPHCVSQDQFDWCCDQLPDRLNAIFLHQCVEGAVAEAGTRLSGISTAAVGVKRARGVWAGDIHKPQQVGPVTYVGAPYHVRFGDNFKPRCLHLSDEARESTDLLFPAPRKWTATVRDADDLERMPGLKAGDQIKVTIELSREEVTEWAAHKKRVLDACRDANLEVFGIDLKVNGGAKRERPRLEQGSKVERPADVLKAFCKYEATPSAIKGVGLDLLGE